MSATETQIRPSKGSRRRYLAAAALLLAAGIGASVWYIWGRPSVRAERLLNDARALRLAGDREKAERSAAAALNLDPRLGEAALFAAECALVGGRPRTAVEYLGRSKSGDPRVRVRVALRTAQLYHHWLYELSNAMEQYRAVLELDPDHTDANSELATLLGLCDRRQEAIPHVLRLLRQDLDTDLLVVLARSGMFVSDMDLLKKARTADPNDPNPLVGLAREAQELGRIDEAIALLRSAIRLRHEHAAAHAALGRQLLELRRFDELAGWEEQLPPAADELAETWFIRGEMAEKGGDARAAARCYWEAARRAPDWHTANFRLARSLAALGQPEASARISEHVERLQDLRGLQSRAFRPSGQERLQEWLELVRGYEAAGRLWEARGWCRMIVQKAPSHSSARRYFEELRHRTEGLPLRLIPDAANAALSVELSGYPLPRFRVPSTAPAGRDLPSMAAVSFQDDAAAAGLRFRYFNGSDEPTHRMFEFTGGGAGVLDFDLDGFADVYFTQGRSWPPEGPAGPYRDRLFRNRAGRSFEDMTDGAGLLENGYGQGISVGDIDADGFPELYIANIGTNRLWRNNGDGSFTDATEQAGLGGDEWTTSCVLADLDGDGLPDIYDANYVTADDVYERICPREDGLPAACMPFHFDPQPDRLWRNDAQGRFTEATAESLSDVPAGKGLGVAVWDAHGAGQLSLLVANDLTPNLFFVNESAGSGRFLLQERGIASGLALNRDGKATGCMGIALGDLDDDGRLEVHITNFLSETNTLYKELSEGLYEDRTRELGLHAPSLDVLGFGTQFLDADLDGRLELFVSNGHVDDLRRFGTPYHMQPQLFRWDGRQFLEVDGADVGPYFQQEWLGRPVARLDWNRDGRDDLLVGHLEDDSALLTNTTPATGRFLSLKLFGVGSNRDAIGTTVRARCGDHTIVRQLTAGDGYQASNERRVILGLGDADAIDELVVRWPSGVEQRFENVSVSAEVWLREGAGLLTAAPARDQVDRAGSM